MEKPGIIDITQEQCGEGVAVLTAFVSLIGVRPGSQGRGYARLLLEHAHSLAAAHPMATGVGLDTENPENVAIYQRLGYRVVGRAEVDTGIIVWCMFRPNEAAGERAA